MKTQKSHIKANGTHTTVNLQVKLHTKQNMTPDELRSERKDLNNHLCEALRKYGFNFQDIAVG